MRLSECPRNWSRAGFASNGGWGSDEKDSTSGAFRSPRGPVVEEGGWRGLRTETTRVEGKEVFWRGSGTGTEDSYCGGGEVRVPWGSMRRDGESFIKGLSWTESGYETGWRPSGEPGTRTGRRGSRDSSTHGDSRRRDSYRDIWDQSGYRRADSDRDSGDRDPGGPG